MTVGCTVVFSCTNRAVRTYLWENPQQRAIYRQRAIEVARNLTPPSSVEEFINQPHAGVQVWDSETGESK